MSDARPRQGESPARRERARTRVAAGGTVLARAPGRVRRALHSDDSAILTLEELFPGDRISMRSLRGFLRSHHAPVWVAELDGAVVGSLILLTRRNSRSARIYSVVVAPQARGRRFGERMVRAAEAQARKLGLAAVTLEVRTDNAAARGLYAKLGYQAQRTLPGYYDDGVDGLRLRKTL